MNKQNDKISCEKGYLQKFYSNFKNDVIVLRNLFWKIFFCKSLANKKTVSLNIKTSSVFLVSNIHFPFK